MLFFAGLACVLLAARLFTYGKTEDRPDTTGNTMQDAQLQRALDTVVDRMEVSLNSCYSAADREALKEQHRAFVRAQAVARMNSESANLSRLMATQPGQVRSAYA